MRTIFGVANTGRLHDKVKQNIGNTEEHRIDAQGRLPIMYLTCINGCSPVYLNCVNGCFSF